MKIRRFWHRIREFFPLTFPGTLLLGVSFYLAGRSTVNEDPYGLAFGVAGFALLLGLWCRAWFFTRKIDSSRVQWILAHRIQAGRRNDGNFIETETAPPLFFRFHLQAGGILNIYSDGELYYRKEFTGESRIDTPFEPPVSGILTLKGRLRLQDIFGLVRIRIGVPLVRKLDVYPAFDPALAIPALPVDEGAEREKSVKKSDLERIFMRDYSPGDLTRDINWKASSRLAGIYTRISPESEDKSKVLYIEYRPFRRSDRNDYHAAVHLDQLRSALFTFIRNMRVEFPEYLIEARIDEHLYPIGEDQEETAFFHAALECGFRRESANGEPAPTGRCFLFSTCCDAELPRRIARLSESWVYLTQPQAGKKEDRTLRRFILRGKGPLPLHGFYPDPNRIRRNRLTPLRFDAGPHTLETVFLRSGV